MRKTILLLVLLGTACDNRTVYPDAGPPDAGPSDAGPSDAGPPVSSCDYRSSTFQCFDYIGIDPSILASYESQCGTGGGTWSASTPCTRTSSLGGCSSTAGVGTVIGWEYPGGDFSSASEVRTTCEGVGGTYVAP
jgi:hypothetical protein